jgi:hypothetical protein
MFAIYAPEEQAFPSKQQHGRLESHTKHRTKFFFLRLFSGFWIGYIDGKTTLLLEMLRASGFPSQQLWEIERANRR